MDSYTTQTNTKDMEEINPQGDEKNGQDSSDENLAPAKQIADLERLKEAEKKKKQRLTKGSDTLNLEGKTKKQIQDKFPADPFSENDKQDH